MSVLPRLCFRTVRRENMMINDPLQTRMGSVFASLIGMKDGRSATAFPYRFFKHVKDELCRMMQPNLPANHFPCISINDGGKSMLSGRSKKGSSHLYPLHVSIHHCIRLLSRWEKEYNTERPHIALGGKTPGDYLAEKLKNHYSKQMLITPTKTVQEVD